MQVNNTKPGPASSEQGLGKKPSKGSNEREGVAEWLASPTRDGEVAGSSLAFARNL
jgi:hypothetical protein